MASPILCHQFLCLLVEEGTMTVFVSFGNKLLFGPRGTISPFHVQVITFSFPYFSVGDKIVISCLNGKPCVQINGFEVWFGKDSAFNLWKTFPFQLLQQFLVVLCDLACLQALWSFWTTFYGKMPQNQFYQSIQVSIRNIFSYSKKDLQSQI